jgi:recombination protein RecT
MDKLELLVQKDVVKKRFEDVLGKKSNAFMSSLLSLTNSTNLKDCEPSTILSASMIAATLDLPINQNLGFAYIIPYWSKKNKRQEAQFQMGYKGFIQLAIRTGQYKTINTTEVYEGEIVNYNRQTGDFEYKTILDTKDKKIIGYLAYIRLLNGFEKSLFMTKEQTELHAKTYSQTYKDGYGKWKEEFDAMARKTVLKLLLSKYGILSTDMQSALEADQAVIENGKFDYVDNPENPNNIAEFKSKVTLDPEEVKVEDNKKDDEDLKNKLGDEVFGEVAK